MKPKFLLIALAALAACEDPSALEPAPPDPRLAPAQRVVDIALGFSTTCALTEAGRTFCWGENRFGEFGNGGRTPSGTPVPAMGGLTFASINGTRGTSRLCGVTPAGDGYCAGYNLNGELGDGTTTDRSAPAPVAGGVRFRQIASAYHTCGVAQDGRAYCWGLGMEGALGNDAPGSTAVPREVTGGLRFATVTAGSLFSCGLTEAGAAYCWGSGGMLGNGTNQARSTPTAVAGGRTYAAISAGEHHACALTTGGDAYCWGQSAPPFGELLLTPVRVERRGRPLRQIASGWSHTCVLDEDGLASCWRGVDEVLRVPTKIRFAGLDSGRDGSCGFTEGGAVYCWGYSGSRPNVPSRAVPIPAT